MSALPSFATQSVTVLRPSWTDDHGTDVADWASPAEHVLSGCSIQPVTAGEMILNRDEVTTTWQLFAPLGADLVASDRVRTDDGTVYEVVGAPRVWATGVLDHIDAVLTRIEG